jgi:trans-aconitate 2-methyltransferase
MPQVRTWDGASYDRISGPMEALGRDVLGRLSLAGDETVLDAGCGSGRVTEALLERLPEGRVIALDSSASMIAAARERLGRADGRLEIRQADLLELELDEDVDAIFSTATFHWIADHDALFARLHAALRPAGRLVAQCGGEGNIELLRGRAAPLLAEDRYAAHFSGWQPPLHYAGPRETENRLLAAGFHSSECWLQRAPQRPQHPREFLATIVFGPHVQRLPDDLREPFVDDLLALIGEPVVVDYVRLNVDATA